MTPKTDSVAVLREIVAEIREEIALIEGDRMEYAENAYRVSASVLEEWADRLQEAMLAALSPSTSSPPSCVMNPYPFASLNHFTCPCAILRPLSSGVFSPCVLPP